MAAINYLRKLEKEIATAATATINDSGRRVYEITEAALNAITAKYENLIVNQIVNNETRITTYHTYYQIFVKNVSIFYTLSGRIMLIYCRYAGEKTTNRGRGT